MPFVRRLRQGMRAMLMAMLVTAASAVAAAEPESFDAAVAQISALYQDAMRTLETRGREETAAAVHRLRQAFQETAERFAAKPPPHLDGNPDWPAEFMQIDVRLVGALLVIDMGSRDAARQSLAPLAETLARLRAPAPAAR